MSDTTEQPKKERFAPKEPVTLQPPKDDIIDRAHLAKCDGMHARSLVLDRLDPDAYQVPMKATPH
jgi:membrane-associated progesterone receptor component